VHAALGRGLFVLLNGHGGSLNALDAARSKKDAASELEKVRPDIPSEAIDYSPTWA
jgi:creatinine amidohydrolase/Fe(II)-dependent formamide hydrolase-like protein